MANKTTAARRKVAVKTDLAVGLEHVFLPRMMIFAGDVGLQWSRSRNSFGYVVRRAASVTSGSIRT